MDWHFVVRAGASSPPDTPSGAKRIEFYIGAEIPAGTPSSQVVARNVIATLRSSGYTPSQEAVELFRFAVAAYIADQRVSRKVYDGWTRPMALHVPVSNIELWQQSAPAVSKFLRFLTGDAWSIYPYASEAAQVSDQSDTSNHINEESRTEDRPVGVCLLSGGLDSFIGSVEALASGGTWVLVSHRAKGSASHQSPAQERLKKALRKEFGESRIIPLVFDVTRLKMPTGQKAEGSQRSRSAVFLTLGTLAASGIHLTGDPVPMWIPENGFVSLNVPLTSARLGSHSTRTTHPHTLALYTNVLQMLGIKVTVQNPFAFKTKGEMLADSPASDFVKNYAGETVSCSNAGNTYRFSKGTKTHCGYCIPCIVRRAAMNVVGLDDAEPYGIDLIHDLPTYGSLASNNLKAIGMAVARLKDSAPGIEVLKSGPLPDREDDYVEVYQRGLDEISSLLGLI